MRDHVGWQASVVGAVVTSQREILYWLTLATPVATLSKLAIFMCSQHCVVKRGDQSNPTQVGAEEQAALQVSRVVAEDVP